MTRTVLLLSCLLVLSCSTKTSPKSRATIHRIQTLKTVKTDAAIVPVEVNGKWGYVDATGDIVIEPQLEGANYFSNGLAGIKLEGKLGFISKTGEIIIEPRFDNIERFSEGVACVSVGAIGNWRHGFVDAKGNLITPLIYGSAGDFHEGLAQVEADGRWGYIDKNGNIAIKPEYEASSRFSEGLAPVMLNGKWGYIDPTGKLTIAPQFDDASSFSDGFACTRSGDQWIYIDKTGAHALAPACDGNGVGDFSEGLAIINVGGVLKKGRSAKQGDRLVGSRIGFIDRQGRLAITPQFLSAGNFSEGLAAVGPDLDDQGGISNDKRGYVDKTGKIVIPAQFDWAGDFREGLALVNVGQEYGYIDKSGKYIWKPSR